MYMNGAPSGKGLLISGGYDLAKIELIHSLRSTEELYGGRPGGAKGAGPDTVMSGVDDSESFMRRAAKRGGW